MHPRVLNVFRDRARIAEIVANAWRGPEQPIYVYAGRGRCPVTRQANGWGNRFTIEDHGDAALELFLDELDQRRETIGPFT